MPSAIAQPLLFVIILPKIAQTGGIFQTPNQTLTKINDFSGQKAK
jgi:hypothetical protein